MEGEIWKHSQTACTCSLALGKLFDLGLASQRDSVDRCDVQKP